MRALAHCLHTGSRTSTLCSLTQISAILLLRPFAFPNRSILVTDVLFSATVLFSCSCTSTSCTLSNMSPSKFDQFIIKHAPFLLRAQMRARAHKSYPSHTEVICESYTKVIYKSYESHTQGIPKSYASHIRKSYTSHMRVIHKSLIVMCSRQEKIKFFSEKSFEVIHKSYESHIKVICKSYKSHTKLFRVPTHNFLQVIHESYVSHTRVINRDEQQVIHESYTSH